MRLAQAIPTLLIRSDAHYCTSLIPQMTLGHLFIKSTFGEDYIPTVGWQIDPFGVCCIQFSCVTFLA